MYSTIPNNPFPPSSSNVGGGGSTYVLPVASADTLGGVKVGSRLSIDDGVLSANNQVADYSTDEHATGEKWIDGKTIYRKVVDFGALPNNARKSVASGVTNEFIVKIYGIAKSSNDYTTLPSAATNSIYTVTLGYDSTNHEIVIYTATDMTGYNGYVVLEYTKTESEG